MAVRSRLSGFSLLEAMLALALWLTTLAAVSALHGRALLDGREAWLRSRIERAAANLHTAMLGAGLSWQDYEMLNLDAGASHAVPSEMTRHWQHFAVELQAAAGPGQRLQARVCRGALHPAPRPDRLGCSRQGPWAIRIVWRSRQWQTPDGWREHALLWRLEGAG